MLTMSILLLSETATVVTLLFVHLIAIFKKMQSYKSYFETMKKSFRYNLYSLLSLLFALKCFLFSFLICCIYKSFKE